MLNAKEIQLQLELNSNRKQKLNLIDNYVNSPYKSKSLASLIFTLAKSPILT